MEKKKRRPAINTTIDPGLMEGLKKLAFEHGNLKYGKFIEEGIIHVLNKYNIPYELEGEEKGR